MFEDIPQQPTQPPTTPPPADPVVPEPVLPGTGSPPMSPFVKPVEHPVPPPLVQPQSASGQQPIGTAPPATALPNSYAADEEMLEMFHRESLTVFQKIILVVVTLLIIAALVAGGVWLFFWLDPLAEDTTNQNTNQAENQNVVVENTNAQINELDTDGDGVKDATEQKYGTDSTKVDTDGDDLSDYDEIEVYKTKPLIQDTDGDSYLDGSEVQNGYDPNGPGKLNK